MICHCPHCGKPVETKLAAVPAMDGDGAQYYPHERGVPTLERIVAVVCDEFHLTADLFLSRKQPEFIAVPRQAAMWLARELTELSYQQIGFALKRNHGTIIHGHWATVARMENSPTFKARVERVRKFLQKEAA